MENLNQEPIVHLEKEFQSEYLQEAWDDLLANQEVKSQIEYLLQTSAVTLTQLTIQLARQNDNADYWANKMYTALATINQNEHLLEKRVFILVDDLLTELGNSVPPLLQQAAAEARGELDHDIPPHQQNNP